MRDSNPRGLAPNPLSKSALRCFGVCADVHLSLRAGFANVGGRPRTATTETRTETTLMIKLPMVTRPACRETGSRGRRPDRTLPRFRASAQVIGLWLRLACTCAGCPSLTGQDCGRVLRDFSLLLPDSGGIKPPHQELTVPDAPNPGRSHRTVSLGTVPGTVIARSLGLMQASSGERGPGPGQDWTRTPLPLGRDRRRRHRSARPRRRR